jgi:hypothetical protein
VNEAVALFGREMDSTTTLAGYLVFLGLFWSTAIGQASGGLLINFRH